MDEQSIRVAAVTAVADLQLDCEVKEVRSSPDGDGWCVQFSGEYGQFCDEFQNQFGRENAPEIIREKIKGHLLKQITKIRSKTGKPRRPKAGPADDRRPGGDVLGAPLKMLGEVFDNASQIVGGIVGQAANVATVARDFTANVTEDMGAEASETRGPSEPEAKKPRTRAATKKRDKGGGVKDERGATATRGDAPRAGKRAKKVGKVAPKAGGKSKKVTAKKSKKTRQRKR